MRDGGYEKVEGLAQFIQLFPNEGACREYLFRRRWPQGFVCPRCGYARCYPIAHRGLYQCAACRYQASVIAGTVMEKTRTSLWAWFLLIFLMSRSKTGLSVMGFSRLAGISYKRAWLMAHKIRAAMEERDSAYLLSGFLEMDESYFGTIREGKRGRGAEGRAPVLISVATREGYPTHARMRVIPTVSAVEIKNAAAATVGPGSCVKTDGLYSYLKGLAGYEHERVVLGSGKAASEHLPFTHLLTANVKGMIRGTHHGVFSKHLQSYLSEFCYRFSRRFWEPELFDRLLWACICTRTVTWGELKGRADLLQAA